MRRAVGLSNIYYGELSETDFAKELIETFTVCPSCQSFVSKDSMFTENSCQDCEARAIENHRYCSEQDMFTMSDLSDRLRAAIVSDQVCSCGERSIMRHPNSTLCLSCGKHYAEPCKACLGLGCFPLNPEYIEEFINAMPHNLFKHAIVKCEFSYCAGGMIRKYQSDFGYALSMNEWEVAGKPRFDNSYTLKDLTSQQVKQAGESGHSGTALAVATSLSNSRLGFLRGVPVETLLSPDYVLPDLIQTRSD